MTRLTLNAYYQYDGPSLKDPLRNELSHDDIVYNLDLLENDFYHAIDGEAKIEVKNIDYDNHKIDMVVQAECSDAELRSLVEKVLCKSQLYGKIS